MNDIDPEELSPDDLEDDFEDDIDETPSPQRQPKKGVGFGTAFVLMCLAAVAGTAGGAGLSQYLAQQKTSSTPSVSAADFQTVEAETSKVKAKINRLETALKKMETQAEASANQASDGKMANTIDLTDIEARLSALEQADPTAESDPPDEIASGDDTSEAGSADNGLLDENVAEAERPSTADTSETTSHPTPSSVKAVTMNNVDISGLENRLAALENQVPDDIDLPDLTPLESRLSDIENQVKDPEVHPDVAQQLSDISARLVELETRPDPIPAFPKDAVLEALATAQKSQNRNWFEKVIDSQVSVKPGEIIAQVDMIDALAGDGEYERALTELEDLPRGAQDVASEWADAVRANRE